ncbi:Uncharacterised protein at_DN0428 [Pycnogonum litorale]
MSENIQKLHFTVRNVVKSCESTFLNRSNSTIRQLVVIFETLMVVKVSNSRVQDNLLKNYVATKTIRFLAVVLEKVKNLKYFGKKKNDPVPNLITGRLLHLLVTIER